MFQLTGDEFANLRSQIVTSSLGGHAGCLTAPYAFSHNTSAQLRQVIDTLRALKTPPEPPKRPMGFTAELKWWGMFDADAAHTEVVANCDHLLKFTN